MSVIFHKKYLDYDFGPNHPFRPERANRFIEQLKQSDIKYEIVKPSRGSAEDILLAHSKDYLDRVERLAKEGGQLSIDTPINDSILEAAYYSVGGSILAFEKALTGNRVINLLGGLHHAERSDSSGFCVFNDHGVAIRKLQQEGRIEKALVLDLDVHAGNGTQDIFYDDPTVFTISLHQNPATLYPGKCFPRERGEGEGLGYNMNVVFDPGTEEGEYLDRLDSVLEKGKVASFDQDLTVLVFGVDTYRQDPLAGLKMGKEFYKKVGERMRDFDNLACLCAGGYSKDIPDLWVKFIMGLGV